MPQDIQRFRKNYSSYRVQPRYEVQYVVDEALDWKNSVRVASTGNVALSGATPLSVDSVSLADGNRVLLKNQGVGSENGIYTFKVEGSNYVLSRASDANSETLSTGAATYVEEGTTNAQKIYILSTTGSIVVGSTSLTWTQFSGAGGSPGGSDTYVQFNDGGSFGGVSGLRFNKSTGALTGTYVLATTGFSGSLTKLTDGTPYILAGPNITINTGSNGAVQITGSAGGPTGSGTDGFLTQWTGTSTIGNSFIKDMTPNGLSTYARYYKDYHQFNGNSDGGTWVQINSNGTTGGRIGIGVDPEYPLHITQTSNPVAILEFSRFRNTNAGEGSGVRQTYAAGNFSNPTFRITHVWPANAQGHYTYFGIAKPSPSGTTTPEIVERIRLFSSGTIELSGSVSVRQDSEISLNKSVFDVQKSNGDQVLWISSSAGTNPVGTDVFMFVSGSRTDNNTGADKVVFGGDVRVSGSLSVGTGSVFITSNDIQFGSSATRIQRSSSDMTFFANSSESFRIKSGGNIGINTNNPSEKLHVNSGNVKVDTTGYGIILPSSPTNVGAQTLDCYLETEMEVSLVCSSEGPMTLDLAYDMLRMTRIGRSVHLQGKLKVDATNAAAGGDLWISLSGTGIPGNGTFDSAGSVYLTGFSASLVEPVYAIIEAGGDRIYLRRFYQGSLMSDLANYIAKSSGSAEITISITYSI